MKKKPFNANAATLKWLIDEGWTADLVEYRIPTTWITRDLFGCVDVLAMKIGCGINGYQATAGGGSGNSNGKSRLRKLLASDKAKLFVQCGGTLWLVVWDNKFGTWLPNFTRIEEGDFE